jgi:hypothetical protein
MNNPIYKPPLSLRYIIERMSGIIATKKENNKA